MFGGLLLLIYDSGVLAVNIILLYQNRIVQNDNVKGEEMGITIIKAEKGYIFTAFFCSKFLMFDIITEYYIINASIVPGQFRRSYEEIYR